MDLFWGEGTWGREMAWGREKGMGEGREGSGIAFAVTEDLFDIRKEANVPTL